MTWTKLDDSFPDHPKIMGLSDAAFRLYVTGLCYANRQLTDGLVPKAWPAIKRKALSELLAAGLWEDAHSFYGIHDFLIYNKPRSEVMAQREAKTAAGAKGAASRWHRDGNAPVPDPSRPVLTHPEPEPTGRPLTFRLYEGMGWTIAPNVIHLLEELSEYDEEWLGSAFEEAAANRAKNLRYITAILEHWRDHGRDCECGKKRSAPTQDVRPVIVGGQAVKTFEQEAADARRA